MSEQVKKITIVGGGTAGWITAGLLAAEHACHANAMIEITLIESPDILPIGVGEGTWPSMRNTLKKMGISENEFLINCDASFKQGSQFISWLNNDQQHYYHPFTLPANFHEINLAQYWLKYREQVSFTDAVTMQGQLCDTGLAPKQISTAEYSFNANYGYHLDAGKFSVFLQKHCTEKLNVKHVLDNVSKVNSASNGDIASVSTLNNGDISGDLFIDCSGSHALLIGQHFNVPFNNKKDILFNDSALAVQVPYQDADNEIASCTKSTATTSGWIWDIGLQSRRGVGHVYSSAHSSDEQAEKTLREYITPSLGEKAAESATIRKLNINPGYREKFWHKNCVAIGMSAGFIEPLEASAIALIELSASMISEQMPANRTVMDIIAKRFNTKFEQRWQRIIEFLKLHYVLSKRTDSDYWLDNRAKNTIPEHLQQQLQLWQHQVPYNYDITHTEELFPAASFQYIYYGMAGKTNNYLSLSQEKSHALAEQLFQENGKKTQHFLKTLTSNRALLDKVKTFGFPKI